MCWDKEDNGQDGEGASVDDAPPSHTLLILSCDSRSGRLCSRRCCLGLSLRRFAPQESLHCGPLLIRGVLKILRLLLSTKSQRTDAWQPRVPGVSDALRFVFRFRPGDRGCLLQLPLPRVCLVQAGIRHYHLLFRPRLRRASCRDGSLHG
jgi:hypothetical protein